MSPTQDRVAIVTGGARRIGRRIVETLAADGWAVAIHHNRSAAEAEELAGRIAAAGGRALPLAADLREVDQLRRLADETDRRLGRPTALVNCASVFRYDALETLTPESWDLHLDTNLRGPAFLSKFFAERCDRARDACIVNILDQKIFNLNADFFSYTVAKAALHGLTATLAEALRPGVRVHGIAPGLALPSADQTKAEFAAAHAASPLGRGCTPDEIAAAVRFVLDTPGYSGDVLIVDGGQHLQPRRRDVMFETRTAPCPPAPTR